MGNLKLLGADEVINSRMSGVETDPQARPRLLTSNQWCHLAARFYTVTEVNQNSWCLRLVSAQIGNQYDLQSTGAGQNKVTWSWPSLNEWEWPIAEVKPFWPQKQESDLLGEGQAVWGACVHVCGLTGSFAPLVPWSTQTGALSGRADNKPQFRWHCDGESISVNTFSVQKHKCWLARERSIRKLIKVYSMFGSSDRPKCHH